MVFHKIRWHTERIKKIEHRVRSPACFVYSDVVGQFVIEWVSQNIRHVRCIGFQSRDLGLVQWFFLWALHWVQVLVSDLFLIRRRCLIELREFCFSIYRSVIIRILHLANEGLLFRNWFSLRRYICFLLLLYNWFKFRFFLFLDTFLT